MNPLDYERRKEVAIHNAYRKCRYCGSDVFLAKTSKGKTVPFDIELTAHKDLKHDSGGLYFVWNPAPHSCEERERGKQAYEENSLRNHLFDSNDPMSHWPDSVQPNHGQATQTYADLVAFHAWLHEQRAQLALMEADFDAHREGVDA